MLPFLVLAPIGQVIYEWVEFARLVPLSTVSVSERGFDWVYWQENDGTIEATYVLPKGPGARAGIEEGDVFFSLDKQQYFNVEQLHEAIDGISPGSTHDFVLLRDSGESPEISVRFTRYPTFLYPLSMPLWRFSVWAFTLAAFFHLLGLLIVVPVALRPRTAPRARFSLMLILASSIWIFGNWARLLIVEIIGPPGTTGSFVDDIFQSLTFFSIAGWIAFPPLVLRKVLGDTRLIGAGRLGKAHYLIYLPTLVLVAATTVSAVRGSIGPFSLNSLIAPILFYACCYVATAAALIFTMYVINPEEAEERLGGWSRTGSAITLVVSLLMALLVLGVLPIFGPVPDKTAGWLIVSAQLLSLAPVILVSLATLRQGKMDQVLSRALAYLTVLGLIFFTFIGGLELLQRYVTGFYVSQKILAAFFVVFLLFVFERVARRLRIYANRFFATDRQTLRTRLSRLQEQMGSILGISELAQQTATVLGEAYGARSVLVFIRPTDSASTWFSGAFHPEPPYFTERIASQIWDDLEKNGHLWSAMQELNESDISRATYELLKGRKIALAVPIMVEDKMEGLIVMGNKKRRRALYNLEDVDLLRGLSGQLALAIERLLLVEREKMLIRMSAEAELKALRAQINPHFLFNALNTIISLIEERPEEAEETVQNLSAIFRHTLQTSSRSFISLEDEIKLVNHYLSIEKARFGDRLSVEEFLDPGLRYHPVPAFVVQTIVENSIKHGLEKKRGKGILKIICKPNDNNEVEVCVWDSGVGIPNLFENKSDTSFYGIGLQNIAMRLEKLYGRTDLFQMTSLPNEGTEVKLILPERVNKEDEPSALYPD